VGGEGKGRAMVKGSVVRLEVMVDAKVIPEMPGGYVFLRFLDLKAGWWQSHPFSVAAVKALENCVEQEEEGTPLLKRAGKIVATFVIRPYGGMTKTLHAAGLADMRIRVEGPYRHRIPLPHRTMFLAAGVGVALVLGFLVEGAAEAHWAVGRAEDLWALEPVFKEIPDMGLRRLTVWYVFEDEEVPGAIELVRLGIKLVRGRLSVEDAVTEWIKDGPERQAVMACGPERFLDACRAVAGTYERVEYFEEASTK
jgi:NAD(P)H-flavin reductase